MRVAAPLLVVDVVVIASAMAVAAAVAGPPVAETASLGTVYFALLATLVISRTFEGLYPGVGLNVVIELRKQTTATSSVFAIVAITTLALGKLDLASAMSQGLMFIGCCFGLPLARRLTQGCLGRTRWWGFPMLVFGCGPAAKQILTRMRRDPSRGLRPIGCVGSSAECSDSTDAVASEHGRGCFADAPRLIEEHGVQWVVAAMPNRNPNETARLLAEHAAAAPHRLLTTGIADFPYLWQVVRDCGGQAGIEVKDGLLLPSRRILKRTIDLVAVICGGSVISPLLIAIAIAIKLTSPGPIFYGQKRIGRRRREFTAWKFRSMVVDADARLERYLAEHPELRAEWEATHKLKNDPRVTSVGRVLRQTSLDELPQLWNVLVGEMSLVGPRPIVDDPRFDREYVESHPEAYSLYARVRPGITGLWQVSGRNAHTYERRPQLDQYYVRNWSAWLDIYLLTRTVKAVLCREGAY
ncbi:MAG: undecaprenyl-phosphate galactose phosphotransferase WbaP [Planctomycetota bacterium]